MLETGEYFLKEHVRKEKALKEKKRRKTIKLEEYIKTYDPKNSALNKNKNDVTKNDDDAGEIRKEPENIRKKAKLSSLNTQTARKLIL